MRLRRGYLLAEALCALALSGLLAAAAAVALSGVRRTTTAADARAASVRGGREALLVVAALARDAGSVALEADTAIALQVQVAASAACAVDAVSLTLPPSAVADARPLTIRSQPIEAGDLVAVLVPAAGAATTWWRARVDSVQTRSAAEPCGVAQGWTSAADASAGRSRLFLTPAPTASVSLGAPVRIARAGRLAIYASGSGEWMLGWRRCAGAPVVCGAVQPVAGPLRTPGSGGLRLRFDPMEGGLVIEVRVPGDAGVLRSVVALRDVPP